MVKKNTPPVENELSGRLQVVRGKMTQDEFAKALGVGRTTLIRYESGERVPDANFLQVLSLKFNVDPSWLLLGVGKAPEREQVTPDKQALLDAYDGMSEENKRAILQIGESLSQPKPSKFVS
ncbi:helix-turn-helix transcriptional regulator [Salmonella enterica]|uniref:helix-turn-helix domain-containing protein n=1 Tax=Salmonella enterica TaxID=28901 RepID=UPI0009B070D9|nr:helix-turn-helix transcriptional regulator [Salmonella enterica]EAA9933508.1 XRE family transcriptional regulator [Salmonella enterica subsp. salamae]ECC8832774.1 XRE family transcriptional regulator [Salmonella enterica subsp. salamae]EGX0284752.1 helix-turn-helix transcriptional regulator [Salmonella enterica]ELU8418697.1 helix-turn-helix transcriptional regulator [Salmonella enterica]